MPATSPETPPTGRLHIQGPHWTSALSVYDHSFRQVLQGVGEINKQVSPGVYEIEAIVGSAADRRQVVVHPGGTGTIGPSDWDIQLSTVAPLQGSTTTHEWHEGPAGGLSRQITWNQSSGESRLFLFARALERDRGAEFESGLRLLDATGKVVTDFSKGVERSDAESYLAFTADLPPGGYALGYARRGVPARWQPVWLSKEFETQLFIPVVSRRGRRAEKEPGAETGRSGSMRPVLSRMSVQMARQGDGFKADDDLMRAAEALLAAIQRGRLLPDDLSGAQADATLGGGQLSQQMEELLQGKFDNPWLGILALHGLVLAGERYRTLGEGVLHRMKVLIPDHPDLRAVELALEPQGTSTPFPFPPMLRAGLRLVQAHATRHAETVPTESRTVDAIENLVAGGPWTAWHSPTRIRPQTLDAPSRPPQADDNAYGFTTNPAAVSASSAFERPYPFITGTRFESVAPVSFVEQASIDRAAAQVSFDAPAMPEVRVDRPDVRGVIEEARTLSTAQEISRQIGLPLARTQQIVEKLLTEPDRFAQPLSKSEQAVVATALQTSRRTRPQQERRAAETSLDLVYLRLTQWARDMERCAPSLRQLPMQDIAARLAAMAQTLLQRDDLVVVTGLSGEIRSVNRALLVYAGFEPDAFTAFWRTGYAETLQQALAQAPATNAEAAPINLPRHAGDAIACELRRAPVTDERTGEQIAVANMLRTPTPPLNPEARERVRSQTAELGLYLPLLVHARPEDASRYLSSVMRAMDQLGEVIF